MSILSDELPVHSLPPALNLDVLKIDACARVGLVAADDARRQDTASRVQTPQSDVTDVNGGLSVAATKRISHAAGATTIRLLHLLRTDINVPPDGEMDIDVLIQNVGNLAGASSWVSLHVNRLHGVLELDLLEVDVTDASVIAPRGHRANRHADTKEHVGVAHRDVLGAAIASH